MSETSRDHEIVKELLSGGSGKHRIVKELSNPHKEFRFLGMDLEKKQFAILAGMLAPIALIYRLDLFEYLGLSGSQILAIIVPFVALGFAFAFLKWEGRDLSFIVTKKLQGLTRQRVLKWRATPPGSVMWLRDSVQRWLPVDEPVWRMIRTNNGTYVRIVAVEQSSLGLASEEEQEANRERLADAYKAMEFDITEITRSRPSAMGTYIARLQDEVSREVGRRDVCAEEAIKVRAFADDHIAHLKDLVVESESYEHKSFIVVTYNPKKEERSSADNPLQQLKDLFLSVIPVGLKKRRASSQDAAREQQDVNHAWRTLGRRVDDVIKHYGKLGLILREMGEKESLEFVREEAGGSNLEGITTDTGAPAESRIGMRIGLTTTLTDTAFEGLDKKAIAKRISAAEEVREESGDDDTPSAIGLGELWVNDRIAPDAVRIESDHLVVGTSYHRTLYIYDMPESVNKDFLQPLAELKHRIKIVKFMRKIPTHQALKFIGKKKSQLLAAEKTTSDGNVLDRQYKEQARKAANTAHEEVGGRRQSYHQLAVLIHIEADSKDELEDLTRTVKDELDGRYAATRMALEEMWEGYVSCLPLGENHLVEKYCSSGLLSDAVSCFATFSSVEINDSRGVLYGTDQTSNALVRYDRRRADNRHMLIWGATGSGKTVLVKAISTRSRYRGETQILIDPEGKTRYEVVAREIGGQFVRLGKRGSKSRINPLDLTSGYPDLGLLGEDIDEDEDPEEALTEAQAGAFTNKKESVITLLGLMSTADDDTANLGNLDHGLRGKLEEVLTEVYEDAGITEDPETHSATPPTMTEVFAKLAEFAEEDGELDELYKRLYAWHSGGLRNIFDGQTNVNLSSKYLVIRVDANTNAPEKAPLMFVLLDYLSNRLADPREPITCWIDEFWSLLKYPMAAEHLNHLWRASRAAGTSMVGITQDLDEFTSSEHAPAIINQSDTIVLLKQKKHFVERLNEYIDIDERTRRKVSTFSRGDALLIAGQRQLRIHVNISEHEKEIFHTQAASLSDEPAEQPQLTRGQAQDEGSGEKTSALPERKESATLRSARRKHRQAPTLGELAPLPSMAPAENDHHNGQSTAAERDGTIYTITGPSSTQVGFALSGMLATAATRHETDGRVLFVDASNVLSCSPLFAGIQLPSIDGLVYDLETGSKNGGRDTEARTAAATASAVTQQTNGAALTTRQAQSACHGNRLEDYLIRDGGSGLSVLRYPEQDSIPATELAEYLRAHFDAIIVATSKRSGGRGGGHHWPRYGEEWVLSASRISVAASTQDALSKSFGHLEEIGDFNQEPLKVLTTDSEGASSRKTQTRGLLTLPEAEELTDHMNQGLFLPIEDPDQGEGFAWLAHRLSG
ncbi:MAG: type IV secretion system DNA-binding domain-containing protein [Rubrobacter sp.]|nr:type IV secretion system DNA-binding domain-containing protein [Rubrobacter sp.]